MAEPARKSEKTMNAKGGSPSGPKGKKVSKGTNGPEMKVNPRKGKTDKINGITRINY